MLLQLGFLILNSKLGSELRNAARQDTSDMGYFHSLWDCICRVKMVEVTNFKLGSGHRGGVQQSHDSPETLGSKAAEQLLLLRDPNKFVQIQ
jgi:hypothetical protein